MGNVDGVPGSLVVLTSHQGVIAGSIRLGEALFELTPAGNGQHTLFQVNETALPPDGPHTTIDPTATQENGGDPSTPSRTEPSTSQATAGYVIDLMVIYTSASRSRYGQAGIEALIMSAVESANQAYLNSAIDKQLNIVYMGEVSYSETGNMGDALTRLRSTSDGYMDEVHSLRNAYGADLVAMINEDANYCGIAYVMSSESASFAPWAFSVTLSSCLSNHTLAHEIGHNDGTMHDRDNSSSSGAYPYAYGFRRCVTDGTGFRTIMSYSCSGGTRISHFSNPNVFYNSFATGIDYDIDPANSADAARSMNNTADTIAAFRLTTTTPPTAPTNLSAVTISYDQIDLSWNDTASEESGFQVEQSLDNLAWSVVASLSANATSYSDTGLTSSTAYFYRVRAYNGAGNSDYSNIDSSTTDDPPPPPQAPGNLVATTVSGTQIDLNWNDTASETGFRVERSLDNQAWSVIASRNADSTTYSDTGLQLATTYYYQIYAFNISGDSPPSSPAETVTLAYTDYYAASETSNAGSVTGTYADTWFDDGVAETITEVESGGKPSKRYSFLEHTWTFNIGSGSAITLHVNTFGSASTDGDTFLFQYAVDGGAFVDTFELMGNNLTGWETWLLPSIAGGGTVDIRVIDTDRTRGHRAADTISVDELFIRVESDPNGTPPTTPSELAATTPSANEVALSWRDNGNDEYGFQIERLRDGATWDLIADVEANRVLYQDLSVDSFLLS
ncbi:MAG: fibronectin type III domain-containing protein [bacterium]|nr:fibronectin type III domain-containing protein [bacterium]